MGASFVDKFTSALIIFTLVVFQLFSVLLSSGSVFATEEESSENTATVTINKVLEDNSVIPATFDLQIDAVTYASGVGDGGTTGAVEIVVPEDGRVTVRELIASGGADLTSFTTSIVCVNQNRVEFTGSPTGQFSRSKTVTDVQAGDSIDCTFTNSRNTGLLQVAKTLDNTYAPDAQLSDFSFSVSNESYSTGSIPFTEEGSVAVILPVGSYTVQEDPVAGFTITYEGCENVEISVGSTHSCSIHNVAQSASLTVGKTLINDNSGTAGVSSFQFQLSDENGPVGGTFTIPETSPGYGEVTIDDLPAGTYSVTETTVAGYEITSTTCASVVLASEQNGSCSITNDDQKTSVIVRSEILNNNGGTLENTDVSFYLNSDPSTAYTFDSSGEVEIEVDAMTLEVFVSPIDGYEATYTNCSLDLTSGDQEICTISLNDIAPLIFIGKLADAPSDELDQDFEFSITHQGGDLSLTLNPVIDPYAITGLEILHAGDVSVSEILPEGWYLHDATCFDAFDPGASVDSTEFTAELGHGYICIFINLQHSEVSAVKYHDYNENDIRDLGEPGIKDWQIALNNEIKLTDEDGEVGFSQLEDRLYFISEVQQDGWVRSELDCNSDFKYSFTAEAAASIADFTGIALTAAEQNDHLVFRTNPGEVTDCEIGNHRLPQVVIDKFNDTTGPVLPGEVVTFTIKVTVPAVEESGILHGDTSGDTYIPVEVTDFLTDEFDYIPGSFTANSSELGDLVALGITSDPAYASPGTWALTNPANNAITPGTIITLSYKAVVGQNASVGDYPTNANVVGYSADSSLIVSSVDSDVVGVAAVLGVSSTSEGQSAIQPTLANTGSEVSLSILTGISLLCTSLFIHRLSRQK